MSTRTPRPAPPANAHDAALTPPVDAAPQARLAQAQVTLQAARVGVQALLVVVALDQMIRGTVTALAPPDPAEPVKAYVWVVQLIIAIIAAIAVYALTPKPEAPQAKQQETPNVEDGAHVLEIDGDVWIEGEGEFVLQHMVVGKEPIKSEGKK